MRLSLRRRREPRHDCVRFLWDLGRKWQERQYVQCECGTWYRSGRLELWALLFRATHPHAAARGHFWYRTDAPKAVQGQRLGEQSA